MAYVAVKGGERAIGNAHAWLAETRRGDAAVPELTVEQIEQQMALAVDRVMAEGSCHDRGLAALAIKQSKGDLIEAGQELGVGAFLTHAPGQVHGPHESRGGARILTVQNWQSRDGKFDFEPVEEAG